MIIRNYLHQPSLSLINKGGNLGRRNKEGGTSRSLEEYRKIEIFIPKRKTGTINKFRNRWEANRHNIILIDNPISINIFIFQITSHVFPQLLLRRVKHFLFINK